MTHPQHPDTALWRDAEAAPPAIGERRYVDVPREDADRVSIEEAARGWVTIGARVRKVTLKPDGAVVWRAELMLEFHGEAAE